VQVPVSVLDGGERGADGESGTQPQVALPDELVPVFWQEPSKLPAHWLPTVMPEQDRPLDSQMLDLSVGAVVVVEDLYELPIDLQ